MLIFKTSWRRFQDMSWRRLQHIFSLTIFRLSRRLEDVLQIRLEDMSWRRLHDMPWRRPVDALEINKCLLGISASIYGLLTNLNQYLANLYLTNLCFTNLRQIQNCIHQNPIISMIILLWDSISRINSKLTLQNSWGNKKSFK